MSVRVRKGGFMVKHFDIRMFVPNVVLETLELHLLSVPRDATGGPLEATEGNRGQFPRTDFGPASQI